MIIYCTSVSQNWKTIVSYAKKYANQFSRETRFEKAPSNLIPREQIEWIENILDLHINNKQNIVIASTYELPILRIMKRIGQTCSGKYDKYINNEQFIVLCLAENKFPVNQKDKYYCQRLTVSNEGEFIDTWPEGFFDERMNELF